MAGASGPVPFHAWGQWPTQSTGMHRSQAWRFQRVATPGRRWGSVIDESGFRRCMKADYGGIFISLPVREPDIGMHGLVACLFVPFLTCRDPTDT
eukprot:1160677-Pelagomonas_calceolata.AAC.9